MSYVICTCSYYDNAFKYYEIILWIVLCLKERHDRWNCHQNHLRVGLGGFMESRWRDEKPWWGKSHLKIENNTAVLILYTLLSLLFSVLGLWKEFTAFIAILFFWDAQDGFCRSTETTQDSGNGCTIIWLEAGIRTTCLG